MPAAHSSDSPPATVIGWSGTAEMIEISRRFAGVQALANVSFTVRAGEVHCLAGENGCGKSTLIKILSGVLAPDEGRIVLDGISHASLTPDLSQRAGVQVIYQDLSLFPNLSVAENIAFHHHLGAPWRLNARRKMRQIAADAIGKLGAELSLDTPVGELPIASRQLVAICRTLAADARVIVMDEPTASLTHREADALLATIRTVKARGIAVVLVSHRLDDLMAVGDRVTVLRDGRKVGEFELSGMTRSRLGELISGQARAIEPKAPFVGSVAPILEVRALSRSGQFSSINLSVRPGEILGIVGRLGAGRTELALSLFGMNLPNTGEIKIGGKPVRIEANRDAIQHGIAYVSEDRLSLGLVLPQSIAENAVVTVLEKLCGAFGLISAVKRTEAVAHWLGRLQVRTNTAERAVRELSGGNQQRVVLAKWLATKPRILILDSPTVGIDLGAKAGLFRTIEGLASEGLAIILISDEVEEVLEQAHRIVVMSEGRVTAEFHAGAVTEKELHSAIYG